MTVDIRLWDLFTFEETDLFGKVADVPYRGKVRLMVGIVQLQRKAVVAIQTLFLLRASPRRIAIGFAIGVFIGIFPTFGLGALLILATAAIWKFNIPAALLGTLFGNPLIAPVWIIISCLIMGISPSEIKIPHETFRQILGHYSRIGFRYLLGNFGVSLFIAIVSYLMVIRTVQRFHKQKK